MTGTEYAKREYPGLPTYQKIAAKAFLVGKNEGINQNKDTAFIALENEVKALREYKKEMEATLLDPQGLCDIIAGM